jgi:PAS domain S-box-containing protein
MFPFKPSSPVLRWAIALLTPLLALLLTNLLWPTNPQGLFLFFIAGVVLTAWGAGFWPALLATVFSIGLIDYFLLEPREVISLKTFDLGQLLAFGVIASFINWIESRRTRTEQSLLNERERLGIMLSSIADGVVVTDSKDNITFANQAVQSMTRNNNLVGQPLAAALRLKNKQGETSVIAPERTKPIRMRDLMLGQNGEAIPVDVSVAPIHRGREYSLGAVWVLHDISERQRTDDVQRESAQHLRNVLDNLAFFVGVMTTDGTLVEVNRPALQVSNLTAEEVIGKPFVDMKAVAYSEPVREQLQAAIIRAAQGETVRYDTRVQVARDQLIHVDFTLAPMREADGNITHIIASAVDISARKQAEGERAQLTLMLELQRQRLKSILANVPGLVWEAVGDPSISQKATFVNDYVENMIGYSVDEWLTIPDLWQRLVHPDDRERAVQEAAENYRRGGPGVVQFRCVTKDGRTIHTETHSTLSYDENTGSMVVRGVTMDITDRKIAEESLARYADDLRRSNLELQQFAYVASHDLQEPLRMVTSYLQLLEQRYHDQLDDDAREFIGYAVDGAARMKALIQDLLIYSRVERAAKVFAPVDANAVLKDVLENLSVMIEENKATITADSLPTITGDERQITQLFQNLISNAIKFHGDRQPEIHMGVERKNNEWVFCVRDNGIGIEAQYLDRIFIIFQRLHNRGKYPGTGIGLAICKKVVERHGGRIWVESCPGEGTTFYFTIPATAQ